MKYDEQAVVWYVDLLTKSFGETTATCRYQDNNKIWWVPKFGLSAWEGYNVFLTRDAALAALRKQYEEHVASLSKWKDAVEEQWS